MERNNLYDTGFDNNLIKITNLTVSLQNQNQLFLSWECNAKNLQGYVIGHEGRNDTAHNRSFTDTTADLGKAIEFDVFAFAGKNKSATTSITSIAYLPSVVTDTIDSITIYFGHV